MREATWTLTLMAAVRTTRAVIGDMVAAGRGAIVTTSSVNAFLPDPAVIDYGAAKAALTNFCKALSKEVGPAGVRVNTVSPGPVSTGLWLGAGGVAESVARSAGGAPEEVARQAVAGTATGRFTTPEEVADLVVLLCGERAGNVTGADFVIDGGLVRRCDAGSAGRLARSDLGRRHAGDRHPVGRAGHVVEPGAVEEGDAVGIAAVLAADPELEVGTCLAADPRREADEPSDARLVDRLERRAVDDPLLEVVREEARLDVVA